MANYMNLDTLKFLLHNVHKTEEILGFKRYEDYDIDSINILLDSTKDWADKDLYPYFIEADTMPCKFVDGMVTSHPQVKKIMEYGGQNGYIGSTFSYENGGAQMPHVVHTAVDHILESANNHFPGYMGLTSGAAGLITTYASQELIDQYVPNMVAGKWGGTMCLTEPQAGSSLSDITSTATPTAEGYYKIKGQKIFISGGDHQACDNIIHLYLARIEGAAAGTKGISLFVVPKFREENGSYVSNDVTTAGDFQKMGQRGYSTVHLVTGEADDCRGWLVGEPHKGLKYMFQMMNGARISVGNTAISIATAAYYASLQYANERPQGRKLTSDGIKDVSQEQTLIINHPDVRRMLLLQKSIVEGGLSLVLHCAKLSDIAHNAVGEEADDAHDLMELLTPMVKTYPSEMGIVSVSNGLQVFGGYGFTMDFPLQQYYRDIRIAAIYEGTTGIQSMDLLGRKVIMKNGRALQLLMKEMNKTIAEANTYDELKPFAKKLSQSMVEAQELLGFLLPFAMKGEFERFLADASLFMEYFSTIVIAWQWLKIGTEAKQSLITGNKPYGDEFYESKILTLKFFFRYELPKTMGLKETILTSEALTILKEKELIS